MISRMPVENEHLLKVFPMLGYEVALLPNSAWWKGPISFFECRRPTNITNYKHVQSNGKSMARAAMANQLSACCRESAERALKTDRSPSGNARSLPIRRTAECRLRVLLRWAGLVCGTAKYRKPGKNSQPQ